MYCCAFLFLGCCLACQAILLKDLHGQSLEHRPSTKKHESRGQGRRVPGATASSKKLTAAVVYLVRGDEASMANLNRSLFWLEANFCTRDGLGARYPVLVFTDNTTDGPKHHPMAPSCRFEWLVAQHFHDIPPEQSMLVEQYSFERGSSYGKMIRWYMNVLFQQPRIQELDYIMRFDDDSSLLSPFANDPFERMSKANSSYGYFCACSENPEFSQGFHDFAAAYATSRGITSKFYVGRNPFQARVEDPVAMVYNNFEVVSIKWWLSKSVQDFVAAVDANGGVWKHRWGDAIIRGMAISLLLRPDELTLFNDIRYAHPFLHEVDPQAYVQVDAAAVALGWIPANYTIGFGICHSPPDAVPIADKN